MTWFIASQLFLKNDFNEQYRYFISNLNPHRIYLLVIAVLLMPVNWMLETAKWKMLIKSRVPFVNLVRSVVAGITIGFVTPGRSGEFAGRVMFLDEDDKAKIFYLSSIGGLAQTAASLVIGAPLVYLWRNDMFLLGIVLGCALTYLLVYFRFDLLNRLLSRIPFLQRYGLIIKHQHLPGLKMQVIVLLFSMVRFSVYLTQYVLLLFFFGVSSNWLGLVVYSTVFLLAQTISPLMPLMDVSFRGGIALYVFGTLTPDNIAVLCVVMMVWLLNLALPAVIGYWFILRKTSFSFDLLPG
jgi:hypothetical protein